MPGREAKLTERPLSDVDSRGGARGESRNWPLEFLSSDVTKDGMADIMRSMRLVTACNLLGLPAAVVPVGIADGLPQAVQLIAGRYCEESCLVAAELLEERFGVFTPIEPRGAA